MQLYLKPAIIFCCLYYTVTLAIVEATENDEIPSIAEVVWVQTIEGKNHIRHAEFDGEQWQETSISLYSSDRPLTGPTIGTKADGGRLLIWVEYVKNRTILKYKTGHYSQVNSQSDSVSQRNNRAWSDSSLLSDFRLENFAPSIVVDARQRFWVVWASSSAIQSDIFMIRELGDSWSSPVQVNPKNQSPDMRPIVNTDIAGNIYIVWSGYDQTINGFIENSALYSLDGIKLDTASLNYLDNLEIHRAEKHSLMKIPSPAFLPKQSRIIVHFPQNTLVQSITLK